MNWVFLLFFIIVGAIIYTSIKLITATAAFWLKNSQSLIEGVYEIATFTQRPLSIYPAGIRFMLTYIIPFAFTSYYPAAYILGIVEPLTLVLQGIITAIIFAFLSYRFWLYGLSKYESSGN
jgi:ABC-2 type transport system permease protein